MSRRDQEWTTVMWKAITEEMPCLQDFLLRSKPATAVPLLATLSPLPSHLGPRLLTRFSFQAELQPFSLPGLTLE